MAVWDILCGMRFLTALLLVSLAGVASAPTRGFTTFDLEGCTLEFETFRDHPQNATMRALLRK